MSDLPTPARDWALFLDVDGTLVEIAEAPDAVRVPPGLVRLLERIDAGLGGALALVSGRPIAQLDALFAPFRPVAAGLHGLELRPPDGGRVTALARPDYSRVRPMLAGVAAETPGILFEDKGWSMALHYRQAPDAEREIREAVARALEVLGSGFHVQEGKMVVELKPDSADKARVVETIMPLPPFRGRIPVFVGDDVTDEDGFAAVTRLGGIGILVGPARPTAAACRAPTVAALREWLEDLAAGLEAPV